MRKRVRVLFPLLPALMALSISASQVHAFNDSLITCDTITIGSGDYGFDFAVLADPHMGCWEKQINGMYDFGDTLWDDADIDPNEKPYPIHTDSCCVAFVRDSLVGRPDGVDARFVVIVGDLSTSCERSEFERARKIFAPLDGIRPLVPLLGNHDGWPYVGGENHYDEEVWYDVCIGEYFVDACSTAYDSLRYTKPLPNWEQDDHLLTPTDSTCESWPSYYENFAFSYQGTRFIATDFTTRAHAIHPPGHDCPGLNFDAKTYGDTFHWTLDWLKSQVDAVHSGERIVCLGHNAYFCLDSFTIYPNFQPQGIADIRNHGLCNNNPVATSIGGHLESDRRGRQYRGSDIVCDYFVLDDTKDTITPTVYLFRVKDNVRLQVTHSSPGPTLSRAVQFTADYDYQGDPNQAASFWWDFGDGTPPLPGDSVMSHTYWDFTHDTTYKVSVRVTTSSGRPVWACDTIHPTVIENTGWTELESLLRSPSGRAVKDGGCMTYDGSHGVIFACKGNKKGDFYLFDGDAWYTLLEVPKGTEGKYPYKGAAMCCAADSHLYLTKGDNSLGFWKYHIGHGNYWEQMTNVPRGKSGKKVKQGASLAWATHHDTGYVYLLKGYRNEFLRYDPRNNTWDTTLLDAPVGLGGHIKWDAGSWLVSDGDHYLYAFKAKYHEFYLYDTDADTWSHAKTAMPVPGSAGNKRAKDGSCAAWYDGNIYAFKGGNTTEFWRYFPLGDSWHWQDDIRVVGNSGDRKKVKSGAALAARPGSGIYAFKGNKSLGFWRYVPVETSVLDVAGPGSSGGPSAVAGGTTLSGEQPLMDGLEVAKPRWNSQGTMICYSHTDTLSEREQIYQCQYGTSTPEQRVVNMDEDCEEPVYSPNGSYIAFQLDDTVSGFYQLCVTPATGLSAGGGGTEVAPVEPDGRTEAPSTTTAVAPAGSVSPGLGTGGRTPALGVVSQITFAAADHCCPEWSLNGQWLCYERDDANDYTQIWRVPASGGQEQQLTFGNSDHFLPSYLNSNEIVFTLSSDTGYDKIAKVNVMTQQVSVLSNVATDHDQPNPSGNGAYVTAEAVDGSGNAQIVRMAGTGGNESWLTSGTSDIMEPDYSQDNQSIFAVRGTGITSQLVWVNAVNGGYTPVTDSLAIRDNPDAHYNTMLATSIVAYEREAWSLGNLLFGGGRRKHGSGVYLSKFRKYQNDGTQGVSLGVFALDKAKPNPATNRVTIRWQVPVEADVSLSVYNTAGQLVKVLANGRTKPGAYTSVWNGTDAKGRRLANGVYFYALDNGTKRISKKVVLTE